VEYKTVVGFTPALKDGILALKKIDDALNLFCRELLGHQMNSISNLLRRERLVTEVQHRLVFPFVDFENEIVVVGDDEPSSITGVVCDTPVVPFPSPSTSFT
jgi:hypothetical protein